MQTTTYILSGFRRKIGHLLNILAYPYNLSTIKHDLWLSFQRYQIWKLLSQVKPIISSPPRDGQIEVVSLVSHLDLPLYLASIKSFIYFSQQNFPITVFDDGSLIEEDLNILKKFIKGIKIFRRNEAEKKIAHLLSKKKYCVKFRFDKSRGGYVRKHIDIPLLTQSNRLLLYDCDLLFFKKPKELQNYIDYCDKNTFVFISDFQDSYSISQIEAQYYFKRKLISKFNSGLVVFNPRKVNLDLAENFFKFLNDNYNRPIMPQTLYALNFSQYDAKKLIRLPRSYRVDIKVKEAGITCKHYIGPIKELFYSDAIEVLQTIISNEKN